MAKIVPFRFTSTSPRGEWFNSLRPRPNRRPFADDIFKCICLNENEWISPRISLTFFPKVRINNIPALVQIMAWRRSGGKPLSEPMMVSLLTHICVTRPQWVKRHAWAHLPCLSSGSNLDFAGILPLVCWIASKKKPDDIFRFSISTDTSTQTSRRVGWPCIIGTPRLELHSCHLSKRYF